MTGGFEHGEDFVAARLSIDIPTEGISALREMTQEIDRYRVGAEMAGRAQDDFVQHLRQTAEMADRAATATQNLMSQMQRSVEMQGYTGTAVPRGYVDPFSAAESGRGRGPATVGEAQSQIDTLRERDPRAYLNMQAARGNLNAGEVPTGSGDGQLQEAASRINAREQENSVRQQLNPPALPTPRDPGGLGGVNGALGQGSGIAQQVLNEMDSGGSMQGLGGLAARGLSAAAGGGLEGGAMAGLGGLAKLAGPLGLGLTGALAANGLLQRGGEIVQNYANMGSVRGGGAAEGFGQEMAIRSIAMNPFISTEQSRQIIQSALTEGYTGKTFDTVTGFISHNLTDMNLDVASSVQLLRKNVNEGGDSIAGLAANLGVLKDLAKTGDRSLPDLQAGFAATSGALINAGVPGPQAERSALVAGQVWDDNMALKGQFEKAVQTIASTPSGQAAAFALSGTPMPQGAMPSTLFARTPDGGNSVAMGMLKRFAQMAHSAYPNDDLNATSMFLSQASRYLPGLTFPSAQQMYASLKDPNSSPLAPAEQTTDDRTQQQTSVQSRSFVSQLTGTFSDFGAQAWDLLSHPNKPIHDVFSDQNNKRNRGASNHIPMLDNIMAEYGGPSGIEILDDKGKPVTLDQDNRDEMNAISSGNFTWRPKGTQGRGVGISETPMAGGDNFKERVSEVQGSVQLGLTPEAAKLLQPQGGSTIRLTPHEQKANAGYPGATPNNAPPGEGPLTRGRSGW